jgi:uncharacterized protein YceH (UPF0502 family)
VDEPRPRNLRPLTPAERRVLGSLLEKEQATPEYYPLTLNALVAACNQKNNREPVTELSEREVEGALRTLLEDALAWRSEGPRVTKWSHNLDRRWRLTAETKAVLTLLLLRGAQTAGELRGRSERLHAFAAIAEVEVALVELERGDEPLVRELPREPGRKETRWTHTLGAADSRAAPLRQAEEPRAGTERPRPEGGGEDLATRLADLEARVAALEARLAAVRPEGR